MIIKLTLLFSSLTSYYSVTNLTHLVNKQNVNIGHLRSNLRRKVNNLNYINKTQLHQLKRNFNYAKISMINSSILHYS